MFCLRNKCFRDFLSVDRVSDMHSGAETAESGWSLSSAVVFCTLVELCPLHSTPLQ